VVLKLLEGKNVNLRIIEKEDLSLVKDWVNNLDFGGEYEPVIQETLADVEKEYSRLNGGQWFFVEKKDGSKLGYVAHYLAAGKLTEIGYALVPNERGKGYGTEAVRIIVDYLFLARSIVRIQATTDPKNLASQRLLEKAGFKREGTIRKHIFMRGEWRDSYLYSILKEEWKEPRILAKSAAE